MDQPTQRAGNQNAIWEYYQNEAPESFSGSLGRIRFLVGRIQKPAAVLNIGCGSGIFEQLALRKGLRTFSLDPSEKAIKQLQSRLNIGDNARAGYIQSIPFPDESFDAVVVSEVLEHLSLDVVRQGLGDVRRVLKPGGRLLGTVPSREDLKQQTVVCPSCAHTFHRWGHEQSFEPVNLRVLLSEYFQVKTVMERPFVTWNSLNGKGKAAAVAKWLLWSVGCHGAGENIYFEAAKSDPAGTVRPPL